MTTLPDTYQVYAYRDRALIDSAYVRCRGEQSEARVYRAACAAMGITDSRVTITARQVTAEEMGMVPMGRGLMSADVPETGQEPWHVLARDRARQRPPERIKQIGRFEELQQKGG